MKTPKILSDMPREFLFFLFGVFINRLGGFVIPFLTIILTDKGTHSIEFVGLLATLVGLGAVCAGTVGGYLSDRYNRKIVIIIALLLGVVFLLVIGFFQNTNYLPVACFGLGLFSNMHRPGSYAIITEIVPEKNHTKAFGLDYWVGNLGFSGAMLLGGIIATNDFRILFILDALTTIIYAICIWLYIPDKKTNIINEKKKIKFISAAFDLPFVVFTVIFFCTTLILNQSSVALPIDMRSKGISPSEFGFLMALNGILIAFLQPSVTKLIDGKKTSKILALSVFFTAIGFGLHSVAVSVVTFIPAIVIWTFGEMFGGAYILSAVAGYAPAKLKASYLGFFQMAEGLAASFAPILGAAILQRSSSSTLWTGCLILGLTLTLAHLIVTPKLEVQ